MGPELEKGKARLVLVSLLLRFSLADNNTFVQFRFDSRYCFKVLPDGLRVAIQATFAVLSHWWAKVCRFRKLTSSRRSRRKKRSISGSKSSKRCCNLTLSSSSNVKNNSKMVSSLSMYFSLRNSDSIIGHTVPRGLVLSKTKLYPFE